MDKITEDHWIADLKTMTCANTASKIVISFQKLGGDIIGKVKYVPLVLLKEWGATPDGGEFLKNAVVEAEKVFMKAHSDSQFNEKRKFRAKRPGVTKKMWCSLTDLQAHRRKRKPEQAH